MNANQYLDRAARNRIRAEHAQTVANGYKALTKGGYLHQSWQARATALRAAAVCDEIMALVLIDPDNTQAETSAMLAA